MAPGGAKCVLIIDGDNVRRGMLACTLPAGRYSLEFASTAEAGVDLLAQLEPAVVILGWPAAGDLCQRIRSLPAGQSCALLLMDERFREEAVGRAEADTAGADGFLPFPFEVDLLDRVLQQRDRRPGGGSETPTLEDPARSWRAFEERVRAVHDVLDSVSYYQLLQVPRDAGSSEVKQAYFDRSIEFHPDRFVQLDDKILRQQIYEVFKRMSEAFKVLNNPEARSRYDAQLAEHRQALRYLNRDTGHVAADPTRDARTPAGKKYLNHALLAEREGNLRSARMYLSVALQYEPDNDAIQARLEQLTGRLRQI